MTDRVNKLLRPDEVSQLLQIDVETLNTWRCNKRYALPYIKVGRCVRYKAADVDTFIHERRISEPP
jgi:hypothetical protein